jgi:putative hydrolase of the HAD superfamily
MFDAITLSNEAGMTKPHPEMYLSTCQQLGVRPEECVYVGDGGSNELEGAHALNIVAVLLDQEWGVGQRNNHIYYDFRIHNLGELLTLLPATAPKGAKGP